MGRIRIKVSPKEERTFLGEIFASKAEMHYYMCLKMMQNSGGICNLERQPKFELGCPENVYRADFKYQRPLAGVPDILETIVVDVKGMTTQSFRRHRKLWSVYGSFPLHIVKGSYQSGFKTVEIIVPGAKLARKSRKKKSA